MKYSHNMVIVQGETTMSDTVTFGKTSWDTPRPMGGGGSDDFLQLNKDGQYELRIIGESPYEFAIHWTEDVNGQTRRVKCAGRGCVLCKEDHKPQIRYLLEVMNRQEDNKCQLVEFGPQVYNQIVALNNSKHWGDPSKYDILIDRSKARGPSDMYQVMAIGAKGELNPDEAAKAAEFRTRIESVISKVACAATNDEILQKLGRTSGSSSTSWSQTQTASPSTSSSDDSDTDFDF